MLCLNNCNRFPQKALPRPLTIPLPTLVLGTPTPSKAHHVPPLPKTPPRLPIAQRQSPDSPAGPQKSPRPDTALPASSPTHPSQPLRPAQLLLTPNGHAGACPASLPLQCPLLGRPLTPPPGAGSSSSLKAQPPAPLRRAAALYSSPPESLLASRVQTTASPPVQLELRAQTC